MESENSGRKLFQEGWCQALRDDCIAIGGGKKNWAKELGPRMFPEKGEDEKAANTLHDKLNPDRRDRLTDEQERWIMREAGRIRGFSAANDYLQDEINFERSKPKDPKEQEDRVVSAITRAADVLERATKQLAELRAQNRAYLAPVGGKGGV
jgi:hypothetical protein